MCVLGVGVKEKKKGTVRKTKKKQLQWGLYTLCVKSLVVCIGQGVEGCSNGCSAQLSSPLRCLWNYESNIGILDLNEVCKRGFFRILPGGKSLCLHVAKSGDSDVCNQSYCRISCQRGFEQPITASTKLRLLCYLCRPMMLAFKDKLRASDY